MGHHLTLGALSPISMLLATRWRRRPASAQGSRHPGRQDGMDPVSLELPTGRTGASFPRLEPRGGAHDSTAQGPAPCPDGLFLESAAAPPRRHHRHYPPARTDQQDRQPLPLALTAAWPTTTAAQPASCARVVECVAHVCLRCGVHGVEGHRTLFLFGPAARLELVRTTRCLGPVTVSLSCPASLQPPGPDAPRSDSHPEGAPSRSSGRTPTNGAWLIPETCHQARCRAGPPYYRLPWCSVHRSASPLCACMRHASADRPAQVIARERMRRRQRGRLGWAAVSFAGP